MYFGLDLQESTYTSELEWENSQFYSTRSNYSSCQHKSLLLLKQKCEAPSGSHKNNTRLFKKTTPSVLRRMKRNENAIHSREKADYFLSAEEKQS